MAASHVVRSIGLSIRKACVLVGLSRTAYGYQRHRADDTVLRNRLKDLAGQRKRFGSPRLHIMLKRERLVVNHKRTERLCKEEGLPLRRKRSRKGAAGARMAIPLHRNDRISVGRWILSLTASLPADASGP